MGLAAYPTAVCATLHEREMNENEEFDKDVKGRIKLGKPYSVNEVTKRVTK